MAQNRTHIVLAPAIPEGIALQGGMFFVLVAKGNTQVLVDFSVFVWLVENVAVDVDPPPFAMAGF